MAPLSQFHLPSLSAASSPRPMAGDDIVQFPAVTAWIRAAGRCRFNIGPLLEEAGLALGEGGTPLIQRTSLVKLMQRCVATAAPAHHFPAILGEVFAFDSLPVLETFLAASPTLRHALPALTWAGRAMPSVSMRVEVQDVLSAVVIEFNLPAENLRVQGYFVESVLAGLARFTRLALGEITMVDHLELRHELGPQAHEMARSYGVSIHQLQARNAVVFQTRLLDLPLPGAVPDLHRSAEALLQQQALEHSQNPPSMAELLTNLFRDHPALLGQGIERLADRLHMHPRTLQRRLKEEGQSFGDIQSRCRYEHAVLLLRDPSHAIESLSDQLGFSDRHSFTRAFRRWTGIAPSEFRKQHLSGDPPLHGDSQRATP